MNGISMIRQRPLTAALPAAIAAALTVGAAGLATAQSSSILLNNDDNTEIVLQDGTNVQVDPITGNLTATPLDSTACTGTASCDDVQVTVNQFNANPSTVTQGANVSFQWTSRGAWECEGAGLAGTTWNGTGKLPDGNQSVNTGPLSPATYTADLLCSNGPVMDQQSATFTVVEDSGGGPQNCIDEGRVPPAGLSRDTTALSNIFNQTFPDPTLTWDDLFGGAFPDSGSVYWKTQRDQYISLEFTTAGVATGTDGRLELNNPQSSFNFGLSLVTFSQCPGDFLDQPDSDCKKLINNGGINWSVGTSGFNECELEPNTTYYLNVLHTTNEQPPFQWQCGFPPNPGRPADCGDLAVAN